MTVLPRLINNFLSNNKKRVFFNFVSLSALQGANIILPLLTFPYLVRVLGIEKFGLISFALATVAYFEILTDYGFDLSATRQVSIHRNDREKITSIYSSILTIKALLSILSFTLLTILVFSFSKFYDFIWVYYFTFGRVIGKSLFPVWFFQGMEKMKFTTYLNILAKVIFTVAIFLFVKDETDLLLVPIFNSLGFIFVGVIAIVQIRVIFGYGFQFQPIDTLKYHLLDGWHIFISRVFVNMYSTGNSFLLGILTNNTIVGHYTIAARILEAVGNLFVPANSALYPYMSKLFHDNVQKFYKLIKQINVLYLVISIFLFLGAWLLARDIIELVNGSFSYEVYAVYIVLMFKLIQRPYGSFFTQIFINQGRKEEYMRIVKYTMYANFLLVPVFIYFFSAVGLAFATILVGIFHLYLFITFRLIPKEYQTT